MLYGKNYANYIKLSLYKIIDVIFIKNINLFYGIKFLKL